MIDHIAAERLGLSLAVTRIDRMASRRCGTGECDLGNAMIGLMGIELKVTLDDLGGGR